MTTRAILFEEFSSVFASPSKACATEEKSMSATTAISDANLLSFEVVYIYGFI